MHLEMKERIFLAVVRECAAAVGYGRMMQIISHEWWRRDQDGALIIGTCFALLPPAERAAYEDIARNDKIFREVIDDH